MKHSPRALMLPACSVAAIIAFGWYAAQTVRPPDCAVAVSAFTDADGQPLSGNGEKVTWDELAERAYQDMVASGRCDPPAARWRHWLG
ncbi:hypothetical protein V1460_35155 [Streptomyces sp. SCSIO 30461]|uniref:hypothetical protein n=1 Tax=Streptomyces sp. SCSIO 30461 TaxID=3118085 RepID=UPI0030D5C863